MTDGANDWTARYGVSQEAIDVLREALRRGGGRQAQFSHPELGGMGQWSAGGMTQLGRHVQFRSARQGECAVRGACG